MIVILKKKWKNPNGKVIPVGRKIEVINEVGNALVSKGIADFVSKDTRATVIIPVPKEEKVESDKKEDVEKDEKSNKNK